MQDDNGKTKTKVNFVNAFLSEEQRKLRLKNIRKWLGMDNIQEKEVKEKTYCPTCPEEWELVYDEYTNLHYCGACGLTYKKEEIENKIRDFTQDEIEHFEKFKAEFYQYQEKTETITQVIQRLSSVGYSIINKTKSFQENLNIFDFDLFQSCIELSIADLNQLLRFIKKIIADSKGEK